LISSSRAIGAANGVPLLGALLRWLRRRRAAQV
jgi:hypothetical protein